MRKDLIKEIQWHILTKLVEHRYWVHKHTNINNLPKGLPSELRNSKHVRKAIKELITKGFLLGKPTHYGLEVSLNIKKKKDIEDFIERGGL